eukprot:SAG22_NODE_2976_length_2057_cov_1.168029_2_plen_173_part_00
MGNHAKHFATTVANVEHTFAEKNQACVEKLADVAGQVADQKAATATQVEALKARIDEERKAAVERDTATAEHFRKTVRTSEAKALELIDETKAEFGSRDRALQDEHQFFTARFAELDKNLVDQVAVRRVVVLVRHRLSAVLPLEFYRRQCLSLPPVCHRCCPTGSRPTTPTC